MKKNPRHDSNFIEPALLEPYADDDAAWENLDAWREWVEVRAAREPSYLSQASIDEWF